MVDGDPVDVLGNIEKALFSPKVDVYVLAQFNTLRIKIKDFDPDKFRVPLLARVRNNKVKLDWVLAKTDTIYAMLAPYSGIPSLVENSDVISLEASRGTDVIDSDYSD